MSQGEGQLSQYFLDLHHTLDDSRIVTFFRANPNALACVFFLGIDRTLLLPERSVHMNIVETLSGLLKVA